VGERVYRSAYLTLALDGGELSASRPGRLNPGVYWIGVGVGATIHLDGVQESILDLPGLEAFPLGGLRTDCAEHMLTEETLPCV
jgi:hypothetical protein